MTTAGRDIFDAHLDLAYLAELGRDMTRPLGALDESTDPHAPATVTLPELGAAGVRRCLGTIFTEASDDAAGRYAAVAYPPGDARAAYFRGIDQLNRYHAWQRDGLIRFFGEPEPAGAPIELGILMECADPIIDPHDLSFWVGRGVVAIGLTWVHQSRYAGGNATDTGVTAQGHDLLREMHRLGVALDLSHLSQRATMDALDHAELRVCASHSNCRALLGGRHADGWQRHVDDDTVRAVAARGGVIGLNLYRRFVRPGLGDGERPSLDDALRHIEHVCAVTGSAAHAGLGSDLDGGFAATSLPMGIDRASDLGRLFDRLAERGFSDEDIRGFAWANWSRFFGLSA